MTYSFKSINLDLVKSKINLEEVITPILTDDVDFEIVISELEKIKLIGVYNGEDLLGFFLYEPMGDSVETHAFIPTIHRNRSMGILRAFRDYLVGSCGFNRIYTTVTGDFSYIVKVLKIIGFKQFFEESGIVPKRGTLYNLYHLEYIKG